VSGGTARGLRFGLAAYAAAIAIVAVLPGGALGSNPPDKILHGVAYACFTLLARAAAFPPRGGAAGAVAIAVGHGAVIEGLQGLLAWRTGEWGDLAADALGSLAGAGGWALLRRISGREGIR
jgi:VanZ family protein